ncbi:MAG: insulinase family protein [Bacteroidales bacterium]|nr:insulinase family protein [Bacteroidales bacterium]
MFEYHTTVLPNGLRVVYRHNDSPVGYCGYMVDCGTRHEASPTQFGMAHFIEHILFKGTRKRDAWHINQRMESVGGELNAFTTKEDTTFYTSFLGKDFDRACELLSDLVFHATAPQHELEKEQEVVIEEIESYRDNPAELIYDVFENRLFAGTSLGHNILGNAETVRSFDHDRCMAFLHEHYVPAQMVFFAYGPMPWEKVLRSVSKHAGNEGSSAVVTEAAAPIGSTSVFPEEILPEEGEIRHQSHCMIGCKTYPYGHPDATALSLLNNLLGGPGMNSRLNQQLREKRGLVYTVESNLSTYTDNGYFCIYFGCDHEDEDRCMRLCRKELQKMTEQPLSERQLLAAKKQFKGQMGISTANLENNALSMAKQILRQGRVLSLDEVCRRIDAVSSQQLLHVARELFAPDNLYSVVLK